MEASCLIFCNFAKTTIRRTLVHFRGYADVAKNFSFAFLRNKNSFFCSTLDRKFLLWCSLLDE